MKMLVQVGGQCFDEIELAGRTKQINIFSNMSSSTQSYLKIGPGAIV